MHSCIVCLSSHPYSSLSFHLSLLTSLSLPPCFRCCIQCGIFSLSNVLLCQETREIYVQEGLLDYTVSMPWIYPPHWPERKEAHRLVSFLGQSMQLQPPSLINLTKARLASMHFGLERVIRTDSIHELLAEVYT